MTRCESLDNDETGRLAFDAFLQRFPHTPGYIMVDAVEEDYRFETLPHTFGRDRRDLLQRRLKQLYRNTAYHAANREGRDTGKRRDDQYLFAALTNPEILYDWVHITSTRDSPLAAICLLPLVSSALLSKLQIKHPNVLLVSQNSAGLRQSFFRNQKLRISRLTPLESTIGRSKITTYAEEIANTRLYLDPLRVMPRDETLTIVIVDHDNSLADLHRTLSVQLPAGQCLYFGAKELSAKIGIPAALMQVSPDALFMFVLGLHEPSLNLASPELTLSYRHHKSRRLIYMLSACTALGLLSWSAANLYTQYSNTSQAHVTAAEAAREQQKYLVVTQGFPPMPTSSENLKKTVETARKIKNSLRTPEAMLTAVGLALDKSPEIYLRKLTWVYDKSNALPAEFKLAVPRDAVVNAGMRQTSMIEGEIRPFKGDYRAAIATLDRFAQKLRQDKSVESVNVIQQPLNVSSADSINGSTTEKDETSSVAAFTLAVVLKQGL